MASDYIKTLAKLIRTLEAQGWRAVRKPGRCHWQLRSPDQHNLVVASATASDHRSIRNLMADLRRAGAELPH